MFKLKGADRKHKQDREKLSKRPDSEKEKFSPQYDCTMLTDLSVDSIYTPPSRGISPAQVSNVYMPYLILSCLNYLCLSYFATNIHLRSLMLLTLLWCLLPNHLLLAFLLLLLLNQALAALQGEIPSQKVPT